MLTQTRLREVLRYNRKTGVFTWRSSRGSKAKGTEAGTPSGGYLVIRVDGVLYLAHRLAWLYVKGYLPDMVDHRDTVGVNNVFTNLREATKAQNGMNRAKPVSNTSGFKGVAKSGNRWRAYINIKGKQVSLGSFATAAQGGAAYASAAKKHFGEFARV